MKSIFEQTRILRGFFTRNVPFRDPSGGRLTPGYQFRGQMHGRERRSPVPLVFRIMASPASTLSVAIRRIAVLSSGLPVVALLTQRLPVRLVPEELLISSVRNDVIHNRRRCSDAMPQALLTKRVEL